MDTYKNILNTVLNKIDNISKPTKDFLVELFMMVFAVQGRINFQNLSRYSKYNECTFRRHFSKFIDWMQLNAVIIESFISPISNKIAAIDCSFIPKAGKKTFGLDRFFSGCASRALQGLEVSLLCIIDVFEKKAWAVDITQTPPDLDTKDSGANYTRVNFYLEQILDALRFLKDVKYIVADGFYAKNKVIETLLSVKKHLITRLREDSNLRYLYEGIQPKGKRGAKTKYDGKVDFNDLNRWLFRGVYSANNTIHVYYQVLNSVHFKRNLKVVMLRNSHSNKYVLLACTDIHLNVDRIIQYYKLRFQIEFLFRDAKQYTGLTHCQARSESKLDYHFNMSMTAINFVRAALMKEKGNSINNFKRRAYNLKIAEMIYSQLGSRAEFAIKDIDFYPIIEYGLLKVS